MDPDKRSGSDGPGAAPPPPPLLPPAGSPSDGADSAPSPDDPAPESLAMEHVTESSRTYPCEACGGELHFDIGSQMLRCQHCGNSHELRETDGVVTENDLATAVDFVRSARTDDPGREAGDTEIVCQNCGGHTTFVGSLTADRCPYCATPIQRGDVHAAPHRLPVDGVLPFQIDEKSAQDLIGKWINSRWFAPSEFKQYHRTGSFRSVYMAYFTYDADTTTAYSGQRGDRYTVVVGSGENRRTETRIRWTPVAGAVDDTFDDIPVFANDGLDRQRVAKLEPWPTGRAEPYSPEFIAGHLCRTYDHDVEECFGEALRTMEQGIEQTIRRDIGGDAQRVTSKSIRWRRTEYKHLLLPIWLLTVLYSGQPYQVFINGHTGEVHGERPYSAVKIAAAVVAALIVVIAILVIWSRTRSG